MRADSDKASILVVDDLPEKRLTYTAVLEELGENIVAVESGPEALKQLLKQSFAVILLDVNMPGMDGFETARLIRQRKRSAATPIIFLTAFADEVRTAEGYATGAVDYLPTPVVPEILRAKVRVFVELFKMRRQVALQAEDKARRAAAEESNRRLTFLASAGAVLGRSLDFHATAKDIARLPIPTLCEFTALSCAPINGIAAFEVAAESSAHSSGAVKDAAELIDLPDDLRSAMDHVLATGEQRLETLPSNNGLAPATVLVLPLEARGRTFATLALCRAKPQSWGATELTLAVAFATRAANALDNAILHEELRRADRQKNDFLSMLAHELRNPLAPISNAVQLLKLRKDAEAELRWVSDVIDRQVTQMVRLVDDLLDISRITCGKIRLKQEPVDLTAVVAHAVEASQPLIDTRRHQLRVELPPGSVQVHGDHARLSQVVTNLLNNAAKYTDEGGQIWLSVREEDGHAKITVRDTGIGIPRDMLGAIFELFTQVDRTLDRSSGGLGIGLTLVRQLVEMHGGNVRATSDGPGRGSEFTVTLPVLQQSADSEPPSLDQQTAQLRSSRVLVVDDNSDSANTLARLLRMAGHRVKVAYDGPTGIAEARNFAPSVVLLDIGLPGMDGYAVATRLREIETTRDALLIAISGYGQENDAVRSRLAGFDHHLVKPVEFQSLESILTPTADTPATC